MNFLSKSDFRFSEVNLENAKENGEKNGSEKSSDSNELIYLDQFDQVNHPIFKNEIQKNRNETEIEGSQNFVESASKKNFFAVKLQGGFTFIETFEFEKFTTGMNYYHISSSIIISLS